MPDLGSFIPALWGLVGMVVCAIMGLRIFATKEDMANIRADAEKLRADIYKKFSSYMSRHETADAMSVFRTDILDLRDDIKKILERLPRQGG